jgi:heme exporter protein D
MGKHGVFVWSVYGLSLFIMLLLVVAPLRKNSRFFVRQSMMLKRQQAQQELKNT